MAFFAMNPQKKPKIRLQIRLAVLDYRPSSSSGCSKTVMLQLPKLATPVRLRSPAPFFLPRIAGNVAPCRSSALSHVLKYAPSCLLWQNATFPRASRQKNCRQRGWDGSALAHGSRVGNGDGSALARGSRGEGSWGSNWRIFGGESDGGLIIGVSSLFYLWKRRGVDGCGNAN